MKPQNYFSTSIHTVLKNLIEAKSKRDNIRFTGYQLASALSMPRSIITKLTHPDESKRIFNPKIETLLKIVEYFREDGFNITIEDLLGISNRSIEVQPQRIPQNDDINTVALVSLNNTKEIIGTIEVKLPNSSKNFLALLSEENIDPFFKIGSIFIIDLDMNPVHDTLIAIKLDGSEKVQIKKYCKVKNKITLKPLNSNNNDISLMPTQTCKILGVVIHINAKT